MKIPFYIAITLMTHGCAQNNFIRYEECKNETAWIKGKESVANMVSGKMALGKYTDRYLLFSIPVKEPWVGKGLAYDLQDNIVFEWETKQKIEYLSNGYHSENEFRKIGLNNR